MSLSELEARITTLENKVKLINEQQQHLSYKLTKLDEYVDPIDVMCDDISELEHKLDDLNDTFEELFKE